MFIDTEKNTLTCTHIYIDTNMNTNMQAITQKIYHFRDVTVIVTGIEHGDTSSNHGLIAFHIALIPFGKGMNPIIIPPAMGK